jgi:hypothetical protein
LFKGGFMVSMVTSALDKEGVGEVLEKIFKLGY